jgi:hypothetical protein
MLYNWCCFRLRPNIFVHLCHYAGPLVITRNSIGGLRTTTGSCLFSLLLDVPRDLRLVSYSMYFKCAMYTRYQMLHVEVRDKVVDRWRCLLFRVVSFHGCTGRRTRALCSANTELGRCILFSFDGNDRMLGSLFASRVPSHDVQAWVSLLLWSPWLRL